MFIVNFIIKFFEVISNFIIFLSNINLLFMEHLVKSVILVKMMVNFQLIKKLFKFIQIFMMVNHTLIFIINLIITSIFPLKFMLINLYIYLYSFKYFMECCKNSNFEK